MPLRLFLVALILLGTGFLVYSLAHTDDHRGNDDDLTDAPLVQIPMPEMPTTFPADLPAPARDISPAEVVRTVMAALRDNDTPCPQAGIATAFNFASPANKSVTGPLPRFVLLVHQPTYAPLINHKRATYGTPRIMGDQAVQLVTVTYEEGRPPVHYLFQLSKQQGGPTDGFWMTDGVTPLTQEQLDELKKQSPGSDL